MNTHNNTITASKKILINEVIKEAWQLVYGLKWIISWLIFGIFASYLSLLFLVGYFFFSINLILSIPFMFISVGISLFIFWCVTIVATMLGVRQAIGLPIDVKKTYAQIMQVKDKLFYLFLLWICLIGTFIIVRHFLIPDSMFGKILSILFYLVTLYCTLPLLFFAIPLIVTKQCDLHYAIEECYLVMNRYWLQVFSCYFILVILGFIGAIPLGIGLIWINPMHYTMVGVLFRKVYSLKKKSKKISS